jgi:hypothetical protein
VDVRENTAGRNRDGAQELGEFLVVADGQLDVARDDAGLLVVSGGVASEFENFGGEVFKHGGEVNRSASADSLRILLNLQVSRDATDRELKSRLGRSAHRLLTRLSLSSSGHCCLLFVVCCWCGCRAFVRTRVK